MDRLKLIFEEDAHGELDSIYKDIRRQMRFLWVPDIFQAIAPFPDFMRLCWQDLSPVVRHPAVEAGAAQILRCAGERVAALLRPESDIEYLLEKRLRRSLTDFHRQLLPFYLGAPRLCVVMARMRSWFRPEGAPEAVRVGLKPLPHPDQMGSRVRPMRDDRSTRAARAMFERIQRDLRVPVTHTAFRALACHPAFLEPAWESLSRALARPEYGSIVEEVGDIGRAWAAELPPTSITREKIEALEDTDEHSVRLLDVVVELYSASTPGLVTQMTFWAHQLHAARSLGAA